MRSALFAALSFILLAVPLYAAETKPASPTPASVGATPGTPPVGATPAAADKSAAPPAATEPTHPAEIQPGSTPKGAPAAAAAPTPAPAANDTVGANPASDARIARMRDRWQKMTPEQKEEMRKKASRRLEERYERLSPQEQGSVNGIIDQINKLSREQRSILLAKIHQKSYQERVQRRVMKEQETKTPVSAPAAAAPAAPKP